MPSIKKQRVHEGPCPHLSSSAFSTPSTKPTRKRSASLDLCYSNTRSRGRRRLLGGDASTVHVAAEDTTAPRSRSKARSGPTSTRSSSLGHSSSHLNSEHSPKTPSGPLSARSRSLGSSTAPRCGESTQKTPTTPSRPAFARSPAVDSSPATPSGESSFQTPKRRKTYARLPKKKRARKVPRTYPLKDIPDLCEAILAAMCLRKLYDVPNNTFAAILCYKCYLNVFAVKREERPLKIDPRVPDLLKPQQRMSPRSEHFHGHSCPTCVAGNATGADVMNGGGAATPAKAQTSSSTSSPKLCPKCYQPVGRGIASMNE